MIFNWKIKTHYYYKFDFYDIETSSLAFYRDYFKNMLYYSLRNMKSLHTLFYKYEAFISFYNPLLYKRIVSFIYKYKLLEHSLDNLFNKLYVFDTENNTFLQSELFLNYLTLINESKALTKLDVSKLKPFYSYVSKVKWINYHLKRKLQSKYQFQSYDSFTNFNFNRSSIMYRFDYLRNNYNLYFFYNTFIPSNESDDPVKKKIDVNTKKKNDFSRFKKYDKYFKKYEVFSPLYDPDRKKKLKKVKKIKKVRKILYSLSKTKEVSFITTIEENWLFLINSLINYNYLTGKTSLFKLHYMNTFKDSEYDSLYELLLTRQTNHILFYIHKLKHYLNVFFTSYTSYIQTNSINYLNNYVFNKYFFISTLSFTDIHFSNNVTSSLSYWWNYSNSLLTSKKHYYFVDLYISIRSYKDLKFKIKTFSNFIFDVSLKYKKKELHSLLLFFFNEKKPFSLFGTTKVSWLNSFFCFLNKSDLLPISFNSSLLPISFLSIRKTTFFKVFFHTLYNPSKLSFLNTKSLKSSLIYFFYWNKSNVFMVSTLTNADLDMGLKWFTFFSRLYGFNKNICLYFLSFLGYNRNTLLLQLEEYFFYFFKWLLKSFIDSFSLNFYLSYLSNRTYFLPLLRRGIRFIFKYPSRGQRTCSNYRTINKLPKVLNVNVFRQKLTSEYITTKFPNWTHIDSFYFHRY